MGIDSARYHGWRGDLRSPWWSCLAIVRVGLLQVLRRKSYWFILALGLLNFLVFWSLIYMITQLEILRDFKQQILEQVDFNAIPPDPESGYKENGYVVFMWRQSIIVMILLAFAGSMLVGADFRLRSLPFYLSRRIDRRHYIVGKLLSVSALCALLTVLPALLLFFEYGMFSASFDYWLDNLSIPLSVLGYGAILCLVMSIWITTLSAYLHNVAPIAITWASLFVLTNRMAEMLNDQSKYWDLLDPMKSMQYVGRLCFGRFENADERQLAWWAAAWLTASCAVALVALVHRVRAVDIVE